MNPPEKRELSTIQMYGRINVFNDVTVPRRHSSHLLFNYDRNVELCTISMASPAKILKDPTQIWLGSFFFLKKKAFSNDGSRFVGFLHIFYIKKNVKGSCDFAELWRIFQTFPVKVQWKSSEFWAFVWTIQIFVILMGFSTIFDSDPLKTFRIFNTCSED